MCGRYTVFTEDEIIEMRAIIAQVSRIFGESAVKTGDICPTDTAPVLAASEGGVMPLAVKWGFPKRDGKGVIFNARSESALDKPLFAKPLLTRRCVIPSTGYYEWSAAVQSGQMSLFDSGGQNGAKTKLLFRAPGENMLYMAGMIGVFGGAGGMESEAFVILTAGASASVSPHHDRMPVILKPHELERWIYNDNYMREVLSRDGAELVPAAG